MKTEKTSYQKAWEKYKMSKEYKELIDGKCIGVPQEHQQYLENRIRLAWDTGWLARDKRKLK